MTDSDSSGASQLLKTDVQGRVRTTRSQREALLDAFEAGGLSGPEFARIHGIKYQTFATWRQKRRRDRGRTGESSEKEASGGGGFTLIEASANLPPKHPSEASAGDGLLIELPGGARMRIADSRGIRLAVEMIRTLNA